MLKCILFHCARFSFFFTRFKNCNLICDYCVSFINTSYFPVEMFVKNFPILALKLRNTDVKSHTAILLMTLPVINLLLKGVVTNNCSPEKYVR
jgi:hypothetical protein